MFLLIKNRFISCVIFFGFFFFVFFFKHHYTNFQSNTAHEHRLTPLYRSQGGVSGGPLEKGSGFCELLLELDLHTSHREKKKQVKHTSYNDNEVFQLK